MEDDPRSTGHSPRRQTRGPHVHTSKATRTSPTAERAMVTRHNLRREELVTVQGQPTNQRRTKYHVGRGGGGGGGSRWMA